MRRLTRLFNRLNFYVAQLLTDHSRFKLKLYALQISVNDTYMCRSADTVKHIIFEFPFIHSRRSELIRKLRANKTTWPYHLSKNNFSYFANFAKRVMKLKNELHITPKTPLPFPLRPPMDLAPVVEASQQITSRTERNYVWKTQPKISQEKEIDTPKQ